MIIKKKRMIIIIFCILTVFIIVGKVFYNQFQRVNPEDYDDYIKNNNKKLTAFAEQLLQEQNEAFVIYENSRELPDRINGDLIYSKFGVEQVVVEKDDGSGKMNSVRIFLAEEPKDKDYYRCGFYYSHENTIIDSYGQVKTGNLYEYDGTSEGFKSKYKSEKICEKWFYFEDAFWN